LFFNLLDGLAYDRGKSGFSFSPETLGAGARRLYQKKKPFSLEKGISGGCPIINNGRDIVKLLKIQYNKVNTMSMM
jgi:hypothetical protein